MFYRSQGRSRRLWRRLYGKQIIFLLIFIGEGETNRVTQGGGLIGDADACGEGEERGRLGEAREGGGCEVVCCEDYDAEGEQAGFC
jgi:hypothetical protein